MLGMLRRRIALAICPEMAGLPYEAEAKKTARKPRSEAEGRFAEDLRRLDRLYAAHTGVVLSFANAPLYAGPLYKWQIKPVLVRERAIGALQRLRAGTVAGVQHDTHFVAINYFAAIWPADLDWPTDIPRPKPKEAA